MTEWWETYFDEDYVRLWEMMGGGGDPERQVETLWGLLELTTGAKVLDAPCGYGRISKALARRGACVLGVDQSQAVLREAELRRGDLPHDRLSYLKHDLRMPLGASGFDAAVCLYTSLGYGSNDDDLKILSGLRTAVRSEGRLFIEVAHRGAVAARTASARTTVRSLPDGTTVTTRSDFDVRTGRLESVRRWSGPAGRGVKASSIRIYAVSELADLVRSAGLIVRAIHRGCSPRLLGEHGGGSTRRVGLLALSP